MRITDNKRNKITYGGMTMRYIYDLERLVNTLLRLEQKGIGSVELQLIEDKENSTQRLIVHHSRYRKTVKAVSYPDSIQDFIKE